MVLIIAAMDEELDALLSLSDSFKEKTIEDIKTVETKYKNKDILISLSGIGKINAAYTASILSKAYPVEYIINVGTAGGLLESQNIGDIAISSCVKTHDLDIGPNSHLDERFVHYADKKTVDILSLILNSENLNYTVGEIVSGDQFIVYGSDNYKRIIKRFPKAICVDMEASAIATVASRLNIPFVIIRSISDLPLKPGNELEFKKYFKIACKNSAKLCKRFVEVF